MYCPQCGVNQSDDLKFCKACGVNLFAVRQAVTARQTDEKFDWSKSWVAEMFLSEGEREKRREALDRERGITPEVKRDKEIKAGVITASVGVGVTIFLYVLMQGIILGGEVSRDVAEILSRIWVAGVIPFFIGIGLIINGLFVGRVRQGTKHIEGSEMSHARSLRSPDTSEFIPSSLSVTEETTRHLKDSEER